MARWLALGFLGIASANQLPTAYAQQSAPLQPAWSPAPYQAPVPSRPQPSSVSSTSVKVVSQGTSQGQGMVASQGQSHATTGHGKATSTNAESQDAPVQRWRKLDAASLPSNNQAYYSNTIDASSGTATSVQQFVHDAKDVRSNNPSSVVSAAANSVETPHSNSTAGSALRLRLNPAGPLAPGSNRENSVALTSYQTADSPSIPSDATADASTPSSKSNASRWIQRGGEAGASGLPDAVPSDNTPSVPRTIPSNSRRSLLVRKDGLAIQDVVPPANASQIPSGEVPSLPIPVPPVPSGPQGGFSNPQAPSENLPPKSLPQRLESPTNPGIQLPAPSRKEGTELIEPPAQQPSSVESSLPRAGNDSAIPSPFPPRKKTDGDLSPSDRVQDADPPSEEDDLPPIPPSRNDRVGANCDAIRTFAESADIRRVNVDSSPSFVQGYQGSDRTESFTKDSFNKQSVNRVWRAVTGEQVAEGRLADVVFGTVIIERADGTRVSFLHRKLSDPDQVYVAESWGIPVTCSIGHDSIPTRQFAASTMTWKASGACHKPLYFEDVQLERYGHEWGPVVQPVASTVRFFGDIAILPYKMGIHPPNECQYPLGYYRPGSCAPWTIGPIPISLRGAVEQAKVVTGAVFILP